MFVVEQSPLSPFSLAAPEGRHVAPDGALRRDGCLVYKHDAPPELRKKYP
jgi:hypothetical protein